MIFDKRLEAKAAGNDGLQQAYKLLMNSSYGKLIEKTPTLDINYKPKEDVLRFVEKQYNHIKCWTPLTNSTYVRMETHKPLDESFSAPQLGCQILSYSKRLMNSVMCLADDHKLNIYYTDTDSIHIDEDAVQPLAKHYEEKYGKKLIGKELGNFHCDFDFPGMTDVKSVGLITLGKKSYIDKLEGVDKDGNKHNTFHIRLKGISPAAIEEHVREEKENNANYKEFELYKRLFGGEAITFNLKANNKCRFQKDKNQEYSTVAGEFKRKVKF